MMPYIDRYLADLHPGIQVVEDSASVEKKIHVQSRLVDPLVLQQDGRLLRCSALNPYVHDIGLLMQQKTVDGIRLKVVRDPG